MSLPSIHSLNNCIKEICEKLNLFLTKEEIKEIIEQCVTDEVRSDEEIKAIVLTCIEANPPSTVCECIEVTRTELLALRNSGDLVLCNTYKIPYSRGCLVDSFIYLTPMCEDKLSHDVSVETPFDNELWEGRYSIDSNRVLELFDNIGNRVGGRFGNEVDRFPWGKTNVHSNEVFNADVYIDCATTENINSNTWTSRAYTDLRGFEGVFEANNIDSYGRIYLNGVPDVDFRRNKVQSFTYAYFNGSIGDLFIRQNTFADNSYIRKFAGATGRTTIIDSINARGDLRHYAGTAYVNSVDILSSGRLYMRELDQDIRYTTISDLSYVNLEATGGRTRLWYSKFGSFSYFYTRAAVTAGNRNFYYNSHSSGTFDYRSGTANVNCYYLERNSNGYVRWDNIAGTYNIYQNEITSRAEHRLNGTTGTHTHYYNSLSSYLSRVQITNSTGSNLQRNELSGDGRILATGGRPTVSYCSLSSLGNITLTNYTGTVQRTTVNSYSSVRLTTGGNMTGCSFGTSFIFNSTGFTNSYVTGFGNINHTVAANNNNTGNFHNQINNLN